MFRTIDNILDWAAERTVWVALSFFTLGVLLILISMVIAHGGDLRFTGEIMPRTGGEMTYIAGSSATAPLNKNVSYAAAPSWGLYGAIILPLIIGLALRMRTERIVVLEKLAERGMLRDPRFKTISARIMMMRWRHDRRIHTVFLFIFAVVVMVIAALDWWTVVISPTYWAFPKGALNLQHPVFEFDWSVAHLMPNVDGDGRRVSQIATIIFSGFAYLLVAGLGSAVAFVVMIDATLFILFICGFSQSGPATTPDGKPLPREWSVVPTAESEDDPLCGFRIFAGFLSALLCASLAILTALLLMVLQNSYLRDPASMDMAQFIFADLRAVTEAFGGVPTDLGDRLVMLLAPEKNLIFSNPQTVYAVLLVLVVAALSLGISWLVLRKSAEAGRDTALDNAERLAKELDLTPETVRERLKAMTFWPLGWVSLGQALTIIGFMIAAFFSLRLMLLPMVLAVAWLTTRMIRNFAR